MGNVCGDLFNGLWMGNDWLVKTSEFCYLKDDFTKKWIHKVLALFNLAAFS